MENHIEKIAFDIYKNGWSVTDRFITEDFRSKLLAEQQDILHHGQFRLAGVGRGETFRVRPEIRSDKIFWMEPGQLTLLQEQFWQLMEEIRFHLNRTCFLGLKSFESHFAMYPVGSFYKRHLDQFKEASYRIVTVVLYLNDFWTAEDGGELRLYLPGENGEEILDVLPLGGRLVVFMSGEIPHEVLITCKERISITGWLKDR